MTLTYALALDIPVTLTLTLTPDLLTWPHDLDPELYPGFGASPDPNPDPNTAVTRDQALDLPLSHPMTLTP